MQQLRSIADAESWNNRLPDWDNHCRFILADWYWELLYYESQPLDDLFCISVGREYRYQP